MGLEVRGVSLLGLSETEMRVVFVCGQLLDDCISLTILVNKGEISCLKRLKDSTEYPSKLC